VVRVQVDEKTPKCLTPEQAKRFIVAVQTMKYRQELVKRRNLAMIYVLMDTAMRKGELLRLKTSDVDLQTGAVRISEECKGRKERTVWVSDLGINAIRSYLRLRRNYSGESLWVTSNGTIPGESDLLATVKKYGRIAGLDVTVHELRHTAITQFIRSGMSESYAGRLAGHTNPATTRKYTHLASDDIMKESLKHSPVKAYI
jgi:integrase